VKWSEGEKTTVGVGERELLSVAAGVQLLLAEGEREGLLEMEIEKETEAE
jgi:hypothetical protein